MYGMGDCRPVWQGGTGQCRISSCAGESRTYQGKSARIKDEAGYQLSLHEDFKEKHPGKRLPFGFAPGEVISGAALRQFGFVVPEALNGFQAWQIYVKECPSTTFSS